MTGWSNGSGVIALESFDEARRFCDTRRKRKLGNNTWIRDYGESIAVRYHYTDVVTFRPGSVTLNSGGWHTYTTKERINLYLPAGYWSGEGRKGFRASLWQDLGTWYLAVAGGDVDGVYHFSDGMTLHDDGRVTDGPCGAPLTVCDPDEDRRAYRRERRKEQRRMRAEGYVWGGRYRGWRLSPDRVAQSHAERFAALESRIDSVLAECNANLPIYRPC